MAETEVLYHPEIGLPNWFVAPTFAVIPTYTYHARLASVNDRYGPFRLPKMVSLAAGQVVEVGVTAGHVSKIVFRFKYNETYDLCMVMIPGRWFVKTVWLNRCSDTHRTLDRSRYAAAS